MGPASIYIPVKIEDLQLDAVARVTMRPLVDKLPCIGAIQIALTDVPFTDLTLKLINNWDILSLPFIHDAVLMGVKVGTEPVCIFVYSRHVHMSCSFMSKRPKTERYSLQQPCMHVSCGYVHLHANWQRRTPWANFTPLVCGWCSQECSCLCILNELEIHTFLFSPVLP